MSDDKKHLAQAVILETKEVLPAKTIGFEQREVMDARRFEIAAPTASSSLYLRRLRVVA